jgi:D-alanine transfer protein
MPIIHASPSLRSQPHLLALLVALSVLVVASIGAQAYAESVEGQYIYALAPMRFAQKSTSSALQRQAFRKTDLLPFYGSSEIEVADPYQLGRIFRMSPTGFTVFTVGGYGTESLIYLQRLAGVGGDLQGKKVVISLAPQFFTESAYWATAYAANFSRLQAYETAFSTEFSFALKQRVARRILDYPDTLEQDPLLVFTLEALADKSPWGAWRYYAVLPLGRFQTFLLQLQDHWATLDFIHDQADLNPAVPRHLAALHWPTLLSHADQSYLQRADNNPYGFENSQWQKSGVEWLQARNSLTDRQFLHDLYQSESWADLDLLLQGLKAVGARPLILSMPFSGKYLDYLGVSFAARQVYYERLRGLAESYAMPVMDFEAHDEDNCFLWNPTGHLSSRGWIFYAQAIDAFYHDEPLPSESNSTMVRCGNSPLPVGQPAQINDKIRAQKGERRIAGSGGPHE